MRKTSFYRFFVPFFITFSLTLVSCIFPNQSLENTDSRYSLNKITSNTDDRAIRQINIGNSETLSNDAFKINNEDNFSFAFNANVSDKFTLNQTGYDREQINSKSKISINRLFEGVKAEVSKNSTIFNNVSINGFLNVTNEEKLNSSRVLGKGKEDFNEDGELDDIHSGEYRDRYNFPFSEQSEEVKKSYLTWVSKNYTEVTKNRAPFRIRFYIRNDCGSGGDLKFFNYIDYLHSDYIEPYGTSLVPKNQWYLEYNKYSDVMIKEVFEISKKDTETISSYYERLYTRSLNAPYNYLFKYDNAVYGEFSGVNFVSGDLNQQPLTKDFYRVLNGQGAHLPKINGKVGIEVVPLDVNEYGGLEEQNENKVVLGSYEETYSQDLSIRKEITDDNQFNIIVEHAIPESASIYLSGPNGFRKDLAGYLGIDPNRNYINTYIVDKRFLESGEYTFNVETCQSGKRVQDTFVVGCESEIASSNTFDSHFGIQAIPIGHEFIPRCPTPSPTPTSELPCNDKVITPSEQANLNNKVQACTMPDKATLNNFVRQNNIVQNLQSKGYSIQATKDERNQAKLNEANALRNQYKDQILASIANLETQANAISQEANTLTGESYNSGYTKPTSLAGYKEELESLQDEFTSLVTSGNTFGMAEASYILTQEVKLYKDLINDYFAGSIQPIVDESTESGNETPPAEEVVETPSRLSTLDTPIKVIRYTTNLINRQKTTFANRLNKLDQQINTIASEVSSNFNDIAHDGRILTALYLYDQGILDLETMSVKTNSFSIQNSKSFNIKQVGPILQELNPLELQNLVNYGVDKAIQILNYDLIPQEYKDESIRFWSDMPQSEWDRLSTEDPQVISELRSSFEFLLNSTGIPSDVKGVAISAGIGQTAKYIGQAAPKAYNYLTKKFTGIKDKLKNKNANSLKNQANKTQQGQNQVNTICINGNCIPVPIYTTQLGNYIIKNGKQVRGNFPNKSTPNDILYRADPNTGKITFYQSYNSTGGPVKRVDLVGPSHGGIPTPHVQEFSMNTNPNTGAVFYNKGILRPALQSEIP